MKTITVPHSWGDPTKHTISSWDEKHNPYLMKWAAQFEESTMVCAALDFGRNWDNRWRCIEEYGFAIPTEKAIDLIYLHDTKIIEIGAGSGYWASLLAKKGADVLALDSYTGHYGEPSHTFSPRYFPVKKVTNTGHCQAAYHQDRALMLVWPDLGAAWTHEALDVYKGDTFIYVGEQGGGCTGSERLQDMISDTEKWVEVAECAIPQWEGVHDSMWIFKRATTQKDARASRRGR